MSRWEQLELLFDDLCDEPLEELLDLDYHCVLSWEYL